MTRDFSRKTKKYNRGKNGSLDDDAFTPPDEGNPNKEEERDQSTPFMLNRVYIPRLPLIFNPLTNKLLVFETSKEFKFLPRLAIPTYLLSFASAIIMMDAFASMQLLKATLFGLPFVSLVLLSTYMTQ